MQWAYVARTPRGWIYEEHRRVNALKTALLLLIVAMPGIVLGQDWKMQPVSLATRWAASVDPTNAWPEYPRPQMTRPEWQNLNGLWDYAITAMDAPAPRQYAGRILVPYPVESALSGVMKPLQPNQLLWYRRTLNFVPNRADERVLLHFGAVDFDATVYLNQKELGRHRGGYQSFSLDITDALKPGDNELVVKVHDPTEQGPNPHGKQNTRAQWMYYTASSGIWQTVWLERVPSTSIDALKLTPDVDRSELRIEVALRGKHDGYAMEAIARSGERIVARTKFEGASTALRIEQPRLWSPDDPYLYDLEIRLLKRGQAIDEVKSYFGLRKVEVKTDAEGRARIYLNNRYTYNLAVVDQGFWPDGLYTAPTDAALKFDVQAAKALGFNTIRKHIKIEPQRWYYHTDRLGLLVWQDMPTSRNHTPQARAQFEQEMKDNLAQLHNHPSISTWVLFNEGWGAYDEERLAKWLEQQDASRLVNGHSGPYDQVRYAQWMKRIHPLQLYWPLGGYGPTLDDFQALQYAASTDWMAGDMIDQHYYPGPKMFPAQPCVPSVTGEFGSYGVYVEGHVMDELKPVGKGLGGTNMAPGEMLAAYADATSKLQTLQAQGLSGSAYFQIADVETEHQGFFTYDRAVAKVPVDQVERLNAKLVPRAANYLTAIEGFAVENADGTPEPQRYKGLVAEFRNGRRDSMFLRRLALMALRQKDQVQATAAGDAFIAQAQSPYTRETWQAIVAITNTSKDSGFRLLRTHAAEIDAALGPQEAEKKFLDIVQREVVTPYFKDRHRKKSWPEFADAVAAQYGELGREAVEGAQMMENLIDEDWVGFGNSYARYYRTAFPRSIYLLPTVAYQVLLHVDDVKVLEAAIRAMEWQLVSMREAPVFGEYDPTEVDTYANLLHKAGRTTEAIQWQEKAAALSHGRDPEILQNLERMKSSLRSRLDGREAQGPSAR